MNPLFRSLRFPHTWIKGYALHWIDDEKKRCMFTGELVQQLPKALPGSVWVETFNGRLHYVDEYNAERVCSQEVSDQLLTEWKPQE